MAITDRRYKQQNKGRETEHFILHTLFPTLIFNFTF
jgi:hypothetical protein